MGFLLTLQVSPTYFCMIKPWLTRKSREIVEIVGLAEKEKGYPFLISTQRFKES